MAATPSDLIAGIEPGSLPQGERAPLEAGLAGGAVPGDSPTPAGGPALPMDSIQDPIAALLSGDINPGGQDTPLTSGLSVGPGPGAMGGDLSENPTSVRFRQVAMTASSPLTRAVARNELRRMNRTKI